MLDSLWKQALESLEVPTCSQKTAEYRGGSQLYGEGGTQLSGRRWGYVTCLTQDSSLDSSTDEY